MIQERVRVALAGEAKVVLAVSGGVDSMALLHAAANLPGVLVAHFNHRTGAHADQAASHVAEAARSLDLPCVVGEAEVRASSEAQWRTQRWAFLRHVARDTGAVVATAHTQSDLIETLVMRILRDARARGLAVLRETPRIRRPLLACTRDDVLSYARAAQLRWIEDPTNASMRHLRNRVRADMLPALYAAHPTFGDELLGLWRQAMLLRDDLESVLPRWRRGAAEVCASFLEECGPAERAFAWPALLADVGLVLDRRGIARLVSLDANTPSGTLVPLSGGYVAVRTSAGVRVSKRTPPMRSERALSPGAFGRFLFIEGEGDQGGGRAASEWGAWIPDSTDVVLRAWRPGDRIAAGPGGTPRRVKRFFSDARVDRLEREGWPVVVYRGEIIWIPGVRRVQAATVRSGGPVRYFRCELVSR